MSRHAASQRDPPRSGTRQPPSSRRVVRRCIEHELGSGHGARAGRGGRGAAQSIINPALISALGTPPFTTEHSSELGFVQERTGSHKLQ